MRTRSESIQTAVLIVSGAAVAALTLWGGRLPDRLRVAVPHRRLPQASVPRPTGREILGADEALRRWTAGTA
jgi:hypothetical protein